MILVNSLNHLTCLSFSVFFSAFSQSTLFNAARLPSFSPDLGINFLLLV